MDEEIESGVFLHKPQDTGFGRNDTRLRAKSLDFTLVKAIYLLKVRLKVQDVTSK
jgi:hypothetical protein